MANMGQPDYLPQHLELILTGCSFVREIRLESGASKTKQRPESTEPNHLVYHFSLLLGHLVIYTLPTSLMVFHPSTLKHINLQAWASPFRF